MNRYSSLALAGLLAGCIPPAPINVKRTVEAPSLDAECARAAALAMPGAKGAVVNRLDDSGYQLLVEFSYGMDFVTLYGNSERKLILSGAAHPKKGASAYEIEQRKKMVNSLLDAIQDKCWLHAAQPDA